MTSVLVIVCIRGCYHKTTRATSVLLREIHLKTGSFVKAFFDRLDAPRQPHTELPNNCLCPLLFMFLWSYRFFRVSGTIAASSVHREYVVRFFRRFFLPCRHGLDFGHYEGP